MCVKGAVLKVGLSKSNGAGLYVQSACRRKSSLNLDICSLTIFYFLFFLLKLCRFLSYNKLGFDTGET